MLHMKQTATILSTYTSDVSGVCSAMFELGGMTIMHDASGCNSTYTTHDEPRWYHTDSMVYVSGLTEMEAVMGDDDKLIDDIVHAVADVNAVNQKPPAFITIAGTPIPMMIGTDFSAIAAIVEKRTGIPTFGLTTNGMHSYVLGAGMAFEAIAKRIVLPVPTEVAQRTSDSIGVNVLGLTPLDFSINGANQSICNLLSRNGFDVISSWAMDSDLEHICHAATADVNLVVSYCGLKAAKVLKERFGIPYVVGTPIGTTLSNQIFEDMKDAAKSGTCIISYQQNNSAQMATIAIIGESVNSCSLAFAIANATTYNATVICPVETSESILGSTNAIATDEDELIPLLAHYKYIIADPLYQPICPPEATFIALPHEAFSGRIYRNDIPDLIKNAEEFIQRLR